jgi:hypothetical protein
MEDNDLGFYNPIILSLGELHKLQEEFKKSCCIETVQLTSNISEEYKMFNNSFFEI